MPCGRAVAADLGNQWLRPPALRGQSARFGFTTRTSPLRFGCARRATIAPISPAPPCLFGAVLRNLFCCDFGAVSSTLAALMSATPPGVWLSKSATARSTRHLPLHCSIRLPATSIQSAESWGFVGWALQFHALQIGYPDSRLGRWTGCRWVRQSCAFAPLGVIATVSIVDTRLYSHWRQYVGFFQFGVRQVLVTDFGFYAVVLKTSAHAFANGFRWPLCHIGFRLRG